MASMTVRLPDDLHERLRWRAFQTKIPMARLVAYALLLYLEDDRETTEHA